MYVNYPFAGVGRGHAGIFPGTIYPRYRNCKNNWALKLFIKVKYCCNKKYNCRNYKTGIINLKKRSKRNLQIVKNSKKQLLLLINLTSRT